MGIDMLKNKNGLESIQGDKSIQIIFDQDIGLGRLLDGLNELLALVKSEINKADQAENKGKADDKST